MILNRIKEIIGKIKSVVAGRNYENYLKLRFGTGKAVLVQRGRMLLNNKKQFFDADKAEWKQVKGDVFVSPKFESNPHIVISGMSGFGKSTLFKSLLHDIRNSNISCIIFDAHNEHSEMVRSLGGKVHNALYSGMNMLELDGASVSERISELVRLFREVYSLGYIQATKLSECLWYTYRKAGARSRSDRELQNVPSIKDLIDELNIFIRNSKSAGETNTLMHLRDRLSMLNNYAFTKGYVNMKEVSSGLHSFSLASMKSKEAQLIYIGELLNRLYASMHDSERHGKLRLYIMIDEAQFLVDNSANNSIITKLIEEGRKYGVGVVIVTHAANTLNKKITANCSTFATFYAREPSEVGYVSKILSASNPYAVDSIRARIGQLKQNEIIMVSNCMRSPTIVSTPKFDELQFDNSSSSDESDIFASVISRIARPMRYKQLVELGISRELLDKMLGLGLLERINIEFGDVAEEWFMARNGAVSVEHEAWVEILSEILRSNGINCKVMDNSNGPDIHVYRNGIKTAVEYETGLKSSSSTLKMIGSRMEKYDKVVIVTRDSCVEHYRQLFNGKKVHVIASSAASTLPNAIMAM